METVAIKQDKFLLITYPIFSEALNDQVETLREMALPKPELHHSLVICHYCILKSGYDIISLVKIELLSGSNTHFFVLPG